MLCAALLHVKLETVNQDPIYININHMNIYFLTQTHNLIWYNPKENDNNERREKEMPTMTYPT